METVKYSVAICDDENRTCAYLETLLDRVFRELQHSQEIDVFYSGEALINYVQQNKIAYDFILLDIELNGLSGVNVGKMIRNSISDVRSQIIYISSKTTYAMELFQVSPLDFLVKPIEFEKLLTVIERGIKFINPLQEIFECTCGTKTIRIPMSHILYFESEGRKVRVVTSEEEIEFYGKLSRVEEQLSKAFVRIHKSYIVSINALKECHSDYVLLFNGTRLSISRSYRELVKGYLMERHM